MIQLSSCKIKLEFVLATLLATAASTTVTWSNPLATGPAAKGKRADMADKMVTKSAIISGEKAAQLSYGDNIEKANLIVRAAYNDSRLVVKQVLKGDKTWQGKTIKLSGPLKMGCRQQSVPAINNAAVLLHGNNKNEFSVVEIYDTPDQIAFLNCLVPIYADSSAKGEHAKLVALSKLFLDGKQCHQTFESDPSATFKQEFLFALNAMRQPENFELVKELYSRPTLSAKDKLALKEWMVNTGDTRALSIVEVNNRLPKENNPTVKEKTPFQKANELEKQGKIKEAQAVYMSIVESKDDNSYAIPFAINKVLADNSARGKVLHSRLPWLTKLAKNGNYLEAQDAAQILAKLKNASCLDALLAILQNRQSIFSKANQTATFAIVELDSTERKRATAALVKEIESDTLAQKYDEQLVLLLELAFIQDNADKVKTNKVLADKPNWISSYKQLQPLLNGLPSQDEGLFLLQELEEQKLTGQAYDWIIFRLGDMREARAIAALMVEFEKPYSFSATTVKEALEKIAKNQKATPQISKALTAIALNSHSLSQANAIELLAAIEGEKSLPVVRQVIKNGQLDAKVRALNVLARLGNRDDLPMLLPMSNYWTGDRQLHYWVMQALGEIKNR